MCVVYALIILLLIVIIVWYDHGVVKVFALLGVGLAGYALVEEASQKSPVQIIGGAAEKAVKAVAKVATATKAANPSTKVSKPATKVAETSKAKAGPPKTKHYKAKWKDVKAEDIQKKLKDAGAKLVHSQKLQHEHFFASDDPETRGYGILSEEYTKEADCKTVLTSFGKFQFPIDVKETTCDKFGESTKTINKTKGLKEQMSMELLREKYKTQKSTVCIDQLPGLNPYVEIDSPSEEELLSIAKSLGLEPEGRSYGGIIKTFNVEYGVPADVFKGKIKELKFESVYNELKKHVKENANKFKEIAKDKSHTSLGKSK